MLFLSMAAFALVSSISPGPVNLMAFAAGTRHGFRASLRHVSGATAGFTLLLVAIGLGLHHILARWPHVMLIIQWAGVAFLLYLALRLALDDGRLGQSDDHRRPSLRRGAALQWLNPKAWLASLAGMGAYAGGGETARIWLFAAIYFFICYLSIACWAGAGAWFGRFLHQPARVRLLNRLLATLLAVSAFYLVVG